MEKNLGCEPGTCRNETVIDEFIREASLVEDRFIKNSSKWKTVLSNFLAVGRIKKPANKIVEGEIHCEGLADTDSKCLGKICTAELVETLFYHDGEMVPAPENLSREIPKLRIAKSLRETPAAASQPVPPLRKAPQLASWS